MRTSKYVFGEWSPKATPECIVLLAAFATLPRAANASQAARVENHPIFRGDGTTLGANLFRLFPCDSLWTFLYIYRFPSVHFAFHVGSIIHPFGRYHEIFALFGLAHNRTRATMRKRSHMNGTASTAPLSSKRGSHCCYISMAGVRW